MTDNATPKPARTYSRPTKYPAAIPRTMTTDEQRAYLDGVVERDDLTLGAVVRSLIDDGIALDVAFQARDDLRADVWRMAREAGVTPGEAVGTMLDFAVRESRRRMERNARMAHEIGAGLGEMGFTVDGVTVGSVELDAR